MSGCPGLGLFLAGAEVARSPRPPDVLVRRRGPLHPLPGQGWPGRRSRLEPAESSQATGKRVFFQRQFQETLQLVSLASWGRVWLTSHRLSPSLSLVTAWQGKCACQDAQWEEGAPRARARDVGLSRHGARGLGVSPWARQPSRLKPLPPSSCPPPGSPSPCPPAGGPGAPSQVRLRHQG